MVVVEGAHPCEHLLCFVASFNVDAQERAVDREDEDPRPVDVSGWPLERDDCSRAPRGVIRLAVLDSVWGSEPWQDVVEEGRESAVHASLDAAQEV